MASKLTSKLKHLSPGSQDRWLSDLLAVPIKIDRIEPILTGHIADVSRLHISEPGSTGTSTLPSTVIVKSTADPLINPLGQTFDSFAREAHFYTAIAPKLSLSVPHCWAIDQQITGPSALIIEDLGTATAFEHHVCPVENALECLSGLHGVEIKTLAINQDIDSNISSLKSICENNSLAFALYNDMNPSRFKTAVLDALQNTDPSPTDSTHCLIHCDFRWDNLLAPRGGTIIDWGDYCTGPRAYDLAYFLATSLASMPSFQHPENLDEWVLRALTHYEAASSNLRDTQSGQAGSSSLDLAASMARWLPLAAWTPLTLLAKTDLSISGRNYWRAVLAACHRLFDVLAHLSN